MNTESPPSELSSVAGANVITSHVSTSAEQCDPSRCRQEQPRGFGGGGGMCGDEAVDDAVQDYIAAIDPEYRPLFDRQHHLILEVHPDATTVVSHKMPTYKVGRRQLHVGV